MNYPEAVIIVVDDEPSIKGEIVGVEKNYDEEIAQRKAMCCLALSITIFIMIVFGYILAES
tara:strand:+ start:223 stop:405 length:183 start_codon:yes stop_codon:yes gene_type:complete